MKPTKQDIFEAVETLEVLSFFPRDSVAAKRVIMQLIESMVDTVEGLDWLVSTMVNRVGKWEGPAELRGIFCAFHKPADGIYAESIIPGFTQTDRNDRFIAGSRIGQIGDGGTQPQALETSEMKSLPLPEGHRATADPEIEKLMTGAKIKRIPAAPGGYDPPAYLKNL